MKGSLLTSILLERGGVSSCKWGDSFVVYEVNLRPSTPFNCRVGMFGGGARCQPMKLPGSDIDPIDD